MSKGVLSTWKLNESVGTVANRVVLAPLTRMRSKNGLPHSHAVAYYEQRALAAGLLIAEATNISQEAQGIPDTPRINDEEAAAAWKPIVEAVHQHGAKFVMQMWHTGRASLPAFQPEGRPPLAPSAIKPAGTGLGPDFQRVEKVEPKEMTQEDIDRTKREYVIAANLALFQSGFDMVEVHGANGYLIDQFLASNSNQRSDAYGQDRLLFLREVLEALLEGVVKGSEEAFGEDGRWSKQQAADRIGLRLSPWGRFNDMLDENPMQTFLGVTKMMAGELGVDFAYIHVVEPRILGVKRFSDDKNIAKDSPDYQERDSAAQASGVSQTAVEPPTPYEAGQVPDDWVDQIMAALNGHSTQFIRAGGFGFTEADKVVEVGGGHAVAFGRLFLANPDLPQRFQEGAELNPYNRATFYGGDLVVGYLDYPFKSKGSVDRLKHPLNAEHAISVE